MNKIEYIIQFIMVLPIALSFVCGTWFSAIDPRWLDLVLRLSGSSMIFILGIMYRDWQCNRKDK